MDLLENLIIIFIFRINSENLWFWIGANHAGKWWWESWCLRNVWSRFAKVRILRVRVRLDIVYQTLADPHYAHLFVYRYMSPECLSGCAYNMKADVYSFSIVLWEILSGKTPYFFIRKVHQLVRQVVDESVRPAIDYSWPAAVQGMMESSFDSDIDKRPVSV